MHRARTLSHSLSAARRAPTCHLQIPCQNLRQQRPRLPLFAIGARAKSSGTTHTPEVPIQDGKLHSSTTDTAARLQDLSEEPRMMSDVADDGWASFIDIGQKLHDSRYEIVRKLGWGKFSSVWCALDLHAPEPRLVAIKALTKGYTSLIREGYQWENTVLNTMATSVPDPHCLKLLEHFTIPAPDGEHLCLVTELMGGTLLDVVRHLPPKNESKMRLDLTQRALRDTLRGLADIHRIGFAHSDLKLDAIMFDLDPHASQGEVLKMMQADPPRYLHQSPEYNRIVSQPLPIPSLDELMRRRFFVSDMGSAQKMDNLSTHRTTSYAMRAPESVLHGPWDSKVDIWSLGCLATELLTGRPLFQGVHQSSFDPNVVLLLEHTIFSGDEFKWDMLEWCSFGHRYFEPGSGGKPKLKHITMKSGYKYSIAKILEDADTRINEYFDGQPVEVRRERVEVAARFISRCLRLDPKDRPKACELLDDPFFELPSKPV